MCIDGYTEAAANVSGLHPKMVYPRLGTNPLPRSKNIDLSEYLDAFVNVMGTINRHFGLLPYVGINGNKNQNYTYLGQICRFDMRTIHL